MSRPEDALISFARLLGLIHDDNSFDFTWFLDPLNNAFNGIPDNRKHLVEMLRALRGGEAGDKPVMFESPTVVWEPINIAGGFDVGLIWNNDSLPLRLGVGARIAMGSGKQEFTLTILARLLKLTSRTQKDFPQQISKEFGQLHVSGKVPVPDFLESVELTADLPGAPFTLGLNVGPPMTLFQEPNAQLVWDCARLAVLVIRAWVTSQAQSGTFFSRIDQHFFPMLGAGSTPSAIQPFPLISDAPGQAPEFGPWQNSVLSFSNNGAGALTFLWHLRALITGSESKDLFSGSFFFPLVGGQPSPVNLEPIDGFPEYHKIGPYNNTPHPNSVFLGITSEDVGNTHSLVLDLHNAAGVRTRVPIAAMKGGFSRPPLPSTPAWNDLVTFAKGFNQFSAGDTKIEVIDDGGGLAITLFKQSAASSPPQPLDGEYKLQLLLRPGAPVAFRTVSPILSVELPPNIGLNEQATLFVGLLNWILGLAGDQEESIQNILKALLKVVGSAITSPSASDSGPLLQQILGRLDFGSFALAINEQKPAIEASIAFGPFKPGALGDDFPIHIGKVVSQASVKTSDGQLTLAQLSMYDVRLGEGAGAGPTGGLIGTLLPDLRQSPGFTITVAFEAALPSKFRLSGGGKIPLQETIGPLHLSGLLVEFRKDRLLVGVDLSFKLAVITVSAYELGVAFEEGQTPAPFLHGLGVSMDIPAVKLAGMFAKLKNGNQEDYVGGAVVRVLDLFQLSAIGGYTQIVNDPNKDSMPSLFIFASLVAPLGGPPWFFITGIAGGFGYNRSLPPPGLLTEHPFFQVMRGDVELGSDTTSSLAMLGTYFVAIAGQHWVAAGIQFTAFGFINGKLVVVIGLGKTFSIQILGLAAFGIEHIAYFEVGIEASANAEGFKLKAGLSKNSYLIHPDIFSLNGEFALGVWYSGDHAGDFVFSIGGYHPYFNKPKHYDSLAKVSVQCVVYGFMRLRVECFFACTPQALMAGASVSLSAVFADIGCGLDVYIDVFIRWDPFFIQARLGIAVWFEFCGRHEISVDLQIHTPPFGGKATIDLTLVSFEIEFGKQLPTQPSPELFEFIGTHLQVPAKNDGGKAQLAAFNSDSEAGLFRVDFTAGRTTTPQAETSKQEGIGTPVPMASEFAFTVRTRLPLAGEPTPGVATLEGEINLPLCEKWLMGTKFTVQVTGLDPDVPPTIKYLADMFPAAEFGASVPSVQSGSRQAVRGIATDEPSIALWDGFAIRCEAKLLAPPASLTPVGFEPSAGPNEDYPLPLALPPGTPVPALMPKSRLVFKQGAKLVTLKPAGALLSSREHAELIIQNRKPLPLKITRRAADWMRFTTGVRLRGITVSVPPTDAPLVSVPSSPPRRAELFSVSLRVLAPKATADLRRRRLDTVTRGRNLDTQILTPAGGTLKSFTTSVSIVPGGVQLLELEGSLIKTQRLTFSGAQTVRAIFLGDGGDFLAEAYVTATSTVSAPAETRHIALFGEGAFPAVAAAPGAAATTAAVTQEHVGIDHDTTLTALGHRTLAGHGCVLECLSGAPFALAPLDAVPGFAVLQTVKRSRLNFPAAGKVASLVIMVAPLEPDPGSALDEIRWASINATLSELTTVAGPESTAFVMSVVAPGPWILELDLGRNWRLTQLVLGKQSSRDVVSLLRSNMDQDLIDDRLEKTADTMPASSVGLEVTQ